MSTNSTDRVLGNGLTSTEFHQLATYNGEVARGIMHTDAWSAKMDSLQIRYNEAMAAWGRSDARPVG